MKWVILIVIVVIGYMIYKGDMGGARDATKNYNEVMYSGKGERPDAKPSIMSEYIKNKEKGSIK